MVEREIGQQRPRLSTRDTDIGPHSLESALVSTGSVLSAVDVVFPAP